MIVLLTTQTEASLFWACHNRIGEPVILKRKKRILYTGGKKMHLPTQVNANGGLGG